jgi:glycerophosphoryl diester phosphodiesterase
MMGGVKTRPMVMGHKGAAAVAPENTLASFARALELGAGGLECDVRATRDRVPVIIHDATLDRTTDRTGAVAELTLAQVREADASFGMAEFRGERVPTLDELLGLVGGRVLLALEYKSIDAVAPSVPILERHDAARWCTAWSFDAAILAELKRLAPALSRTQNIGRAESWARALDTADELACIGVSVAHPLVDAEKVATAKARGLTFYTWTANEPADWARLAEAGVDAIVTDDPGGLKGWLGGAGPQPAHR